MRDAGKINCEVLETIRAAIRPGVTTQSLDTLAMQVLRKHDATPAFLGYPPGSRRPFPKAITVCINEELVHGIPSESRVLQEGDIVSIDCGTTYRGYVGDSAFSMGVGAISAEVQKLLEVTERSLCIGIEACVVGACFGDVSHAIQEYVESFGWTVPREYGGHGVGRKMHEDPHIPNWGTPGKGAKLRPGMTFALEPMVLTGSNEVKVLADHWTVVSKDAKINGHFEHTVAVTENGPEILTRPA